MQMMKERVKGVGMKHLWEIWLRRFSLFLITIFMVGWGAGCSGGFPFIGTSSNGQPIKTGYGVLEELFQTEVVNIGLESLGYELIPSAEEDYQTLHRAVAAGYLDFIPVHWHRLHDDYFASEQMERAGLLVENALQGYLVDRQTAEEYNIRSISDLQDPAIARLFDYDNDGTANLVGCNEGWGCSAVIEHHLDAYNLRATVEHDRGQYSTLIQQTINRYQQGKPILYYTWTPYWVSEVLKPDQDVVWLEVPYTALPDLQEAATEADTSVDGQNLGFVIDSIGVVANQTFLADNPIAHCFFRVATVGDDAISSQNQLMRSGTGGVQNTTEKIRQHAEDWIDSNRATFDEWLATARQASGNINNCPAPGMS
jgi:glycine betaine/proline transport system substrate-binding protein